MKEEQDEKDKAASKTGRESDSASATPSAPEVVLVDQDEISEKQRDGSIIIVIGTDVSGALHNAPNYTRKAHESNSS